MENLYHIICAYTNSSSTNTKYTVRGISDKKTALWDSMDEIGNGLAFNIFECKHLIGLAKQYDEEWDVSSVYSYKLIPANLKG